MTDAVSQYCVILKQPKAPDFMALAKALAAARQTPVQDQVMAAKGSWGILAEHLDQHAADRLVQVLKPAGIESVSLPESSLAMLPEAEPAGAWPALAGLKPVLLSAAAITLTSSTTKTVKEGPSGAQKILNTAILLGTGLPIKFGGKDRTVKKTQVHSEHLFVLDILHGQPVRRARVNAEHFDYSFLKERKLYQILGNFKLLLAELAKAVPDAWRNPGTSIFLENKPLNTMGYTSLADVERETRWLLTLQDSKSGYFRQG